MWKTRITALLILLLGVGIGFFVYRSEMSHRRELAGAKPTFLSTHGFKLGLDLSGGTHLVYKADVSKVASSDLKNSMDALRDVIERRVNIFGVSEPIVQVQNGGFSDAGEERLIVDLPGVTDVSKAIEMIGQTPTLDFRTENPNPQPQAATVDKNGQV